MIETLGWVATSVVLLSFFFKDMLKLRVVNSTGALLWLIYAFMKVDYPLVVVNGAILLIHSYWFITNLKTWKS